MIIAVHGHQERSGLLLARRPANKQQDQRLLIWLRHNRPDVQLRPVQCRHWIGRPGLGCQGQVVQAARLQKSGSPSQKSRGNKRDHGRQEGRDYHLSTIGRGPPRASSGPGVAEPGTGTGETREPL